MTFTAKKQNKPFFSFRPCQIINKGHGITFSACNTYTQHGNSTHSKVYLNREGSQGLSGHQHYVHVLLGLWMEMYLPTYMTDPEC